MVLSLIVLLIQDGLILVGQSVIPFYPFKNISDDIKLSKLRARCILQDRLGFMWFGTDVGLKYFDGYKTIEYRLNDDELVVSAILEDINGDIWAHANADVLIHLDRKLDKINRYHYHGVSRGKRDLRPYLQITKCFFQDKNQYIWLSTEDGFRKFNPHLKTFELYPKSENYIGWLFEVDSLELMEVTSVGCQWLDTGKNPTIFFVDSDRNPMLLSQVTSVLREKQGDLWITSRDMGMIHFNAETQISSQYLSDFGTKNSIGNNFVNHIMVDHENRVWVAVDDYGLQQFNRNSEHFYSIDDPLNGLENLSKVPLFIYQDNQKGIWVSHYSKGISYAGHYSKKFACYYPTSTRSLSFTAATGFFERPNGEIWISTEGGGLYLLDRKNNLLKLFPPDPSDQNIHKRRKIDQIKEDKNGNVWIANDQGIDLIRIISRAEQSFYKSVKLLPRKTGNRLQLDQNGELWTYGQDGVFKYNYALEILEKRLEGNFTALEFTNKETWVCELPDRLCRFNTTLDTLEECIGALSFCLQEDSKGHLWMLIDYQGERLIRYRPDQHEFLDTVQLTTPRDHIRNSMVIDKKDHVWIGTRNGILHYDSDKKSIKSYGTSDGLRSNFYSESQPPILTRRGELMFGGHNGFTIFHPDSLRVNPNIPPVRITNFQIRNQNVPIANPAIRPIPKTPLNTHPDYVAKITLKHNQNDFSLEFAALDYTNPDQNQYKYRLLGYENDTTLTDAKLRRASYTNLAPGQYTFWVTGSNNDAVWNERGTSLQITILPPWYWAWWSKSLYFLLFVSLTYWIYQYQLKRQLAIAEAERLKELDTFKSRLYTNITHEFRTPLTIILGLADQLHEKVIESGKEGLQMIQRSGHRLLNLVNQMLDMQKLEAGAMSIHMIQGDIVLYLKYLVESFHSYAASKNIDLQFLADPATLMMDYDPAKMQDIASNLLSNALKFTPKDGSVQFECRFKKNNQFRIIVRDNGVGIVPEKLDYIFERFYQADDSSIRNGEGTGVGLALTKELVQLLDGEISVSSVLGAGSEFIVTLPFRQTARRDITSIPDQRILPTYDAGVGGSFATQKPDTDHLQLLIIEDNPDVVQYIQSILHDEYQITACSNGQDGVDLAQQFIPDLIITDVMMPKLDGYQVCKILKRDVKTSHIPIILLTAKADIDSKLEGLQHGADAYLTKPFIKQELLVRIEALLTQKYRLQAHYQHLYGIRDLDLTDVVSGKENQFVQQVKMTIHKHLEDSSFGVDQLSYAVAMSNSQLYRKLKAHTGLSAHDLIQSIRLSRAKELLSKQDWMIADVAYATGFTDPDYFSKVFRKEFGMTPSEFRKK